MIRNAAIVLLLVAAGCATSYEHAGGLDGIALLREREGNLVLQSLSRCYFGVLHDTDVSSSGGSALLEPGGSVRVSDGGTFFSTITWERRLEEGRFGLRVETRRRDGRTWRTIVRHLSVAEFGP